MNYPLVKDVATKEIIYLDSNDTLDSAIKLITEHGVRNIVVHDADIDEYAYIGVDEVVHAIATDLDTSSLIVNVGLHPLLCVPKDYNIFEASYFFIEDESLIGVINEDGTLFGVLSYIDILNATMNGKEDILSSPVRSMVLKNSVIMTSKGVKLSSLLHRLDTVPTDCIVIHDANVPLGIVTKRDITRRVANSETLDCYIEEAMSAPVFSIHGDISVRKSLDVMQEHRYKRIFITGDDKTLLGVITQKELISAIYHRFSHKAVVSMDRLNNILEQRVSSKDDEIRELKERYEHALAASTNGIWDWDIVADKLVCSQQLKTMLDIEDMPKSIIYADFSSRIFNEDIQRVVDTRNKNIQDGIEFFDIEYRILNGKNCYEWVKDRAKIIYDGDKAVRIVSTVTNITEYKGLQEKITKQQDILNHQAHHDSLTGLPNRVKFLESLEKAIDNSQKNESRFALLYIDLDNFKEINDSLGHYVGDKVLKVLSQRIIDSIRYNDTFSRLGGDEFIIIEENIEDIENIASLANEIIEIFKNPVVIDNNTLFISCSIGISIYPDNSKTSDDLLKHADTAMYKAKAEGKNCYLFYTSHMTDMAIQRVKMETDLHYALENDEFEVYYQPQFDGKKSNLIGVEALVRWNHKKYGLVSPADFIPLAEETGLIIRLDQIVMKKAMKQMMVWDDEGCRPNILSVNLSVKQLQNKECIRTLSSMMQEVNFKPEWLELEVTESQVMKNPQESITKLKQVSDLGISIAIDDFGTGYSSLAYLKKLPVDKLKIDQSFVNEIPENEEDVAIIKAVIALAHSLNLNVIAEGVEKNTQKDFLVANGCENIQGYLYAKPMPANEFDTFCNRLRS